MLARPLAVLALAAAVPAHAEVIEVGGTVGGTSSLVYQPHECAPGDGLVCATESTAHRNRHGIAASVYARYPLSEALLVQVQLQYAQKGYEVSQPTIHVDYLELPILLRVDPFHGMRGLRLFAQGGVAPALRVWCSASGEAAVYPDTVDPAPPMIVSYDTSCHDAMQYHVDGRGVPARFDLGAVLGLGVGWESPIGVFEIEARITRGLVDTGTWGDNGPTKNDAASVLISFGRGVAL